MSTVHGMVNCMETLGARNSSLRSADLKHIGREWVPGSQQEREALLWLLSPENRQELREWYSRFAELNIFAEDFRRYLERCIEEPLPLKKVPE